MFSIDEYRLDNQKKITSREFHPNAEAAVQIGNDNGYIKENAKKGK